MTPAAFVPQEILERIFRHAATGRLDVPSKAWHLSCYPFSDTIMAIGQVPLVNRHWNEAATRILYWELVVSELPQEGRFATLSKFALLTSTLEHSPRLQTHVRSLRLNTWIMESYDREKFESLKLRILRCCPLVQQIWIHGWMPSYLDQFRTTIATFTNLRYLSIHPFRDYRIPFSFFEGLETMIRGWPNLEHLNIGGRVITDDGGNSVRSTRNPPNNKSVARLTLYGLSPLERFTCIIPNLVELSLLVHGDPILLLLRAQRWKHTLRRLKLSVGLAIADTQWRAVMMALCGFKRLQRLIIRAVFPLILLEFPETLEKITFMVRSEDLPVLFYFLDQKLPRSIRTVKFAANYPRESAQEARCDLESTLRVFCEKRRWKWLVHDSYRYWISSS